MSDLNENKSALTDEQAEDVTGGFKLGDLLQRGRSDAVPGTLEYRGGARAFTLEVNPFRTREEQEAEGQEIPTATRL